MVKIAIKAFVLLMTISVFVFAYDFYKLSYVKRIEKDLYRDGDLYLVTKHCYHYTYGEEAVLKWDGYSGTIIWDDGTTCDCKEVFKK